MLPRPAQLRMAFPAALESPESRQWVVVYEMPREFTPDVHLIVARATGEGWTAAARVAHDWANASSVDVLTVDRRPSIFFSAGVGAHGSQLIVLRWDGSAYRTIFEGGSNSPGLTPVDLDGDGTPEIFDAWSPYCGSYAASPRLVTIFRWNGSRYEEATAAFPSSVANMERPFRVALATGIDLSPTDQACLYWSLGYLAEHAGRPRDAQQAYAEATALDPGFTPPIITPLTIPGY
jgi:hypothetical protein